MVEEADPALPVGGGAPVAPGQKVDKTGALIGGSTQDELDEAGTHYSASTSTKFLFAISLSFYLI